MWSIVFILELQQTSFFIKHLQRQSFSVLYTLCLHVCQLVVSCSCLFGDEYFMVSRETCIPKAPSTFQWLYGLEPKICNKSIADHLRFYRTTLTNLLSSPPDNRTVTSWSTRGFFVIERDDESMLIPLSSHLVLLPSCLSCGSEYLPA